VLALHMGIEAFPLQVAVKWRIPLLIFGESPAEHSGRATYLDNPEFAHDFFLQHSAKVRPDQMVCDSISSRDVFPFQPPSLQELEGIGRSPDIPWRLHVLGCRATDGVRHQGVCVGKKMTLRALTSGTKASNVVCPGVHDYAKFLKRGFGRGTDFANQDVRAGLLTREEGFELARRYDSQRPAALDYYLQITGLTEAEFEMAIKNLRPEKAKDLP
jgi:hypothetical protein